MLSLGFLIALQRSKGWSKQKQYDGIGKDNEKGQHANLRATTGSLAIA